MVEAGLAELKKAVGIPAAPVAETKEEEAKPKEILRGQGRSETLRLNYSIPVDDLFSNKKLLDLIAEDMAGLLYIFAHFESLGVEAYHHLRDMKDQYLILIQPLLEGGEEVEVVEPED